jgi:hypothetical protein
MNNYEYDGEPVGVKRDSVGVWSVLGRPSVGGWSGWVNRLPSRASIGLQRDCGVIERKTRNRGKCATLLSRVVVAS